MASPFGHKEHEILATPVLLFECRLENGQVERWSTQRVEWEGETYQARVLAHSLFDIKLGADDAVDGLSRISLTVANADRYGSHHERQHGWKGSRLLVRFLFYDFELDQATSDAIVIFAGIANAPDRIDEEEMRLSFQSRLNLHRQVYPRTRIQRRCPWSFPRNLEERTAAASGLDEGKYSRFFRCGYSPDVPGGSGTLNGTVPYESCGYTRADCMARGMFREDGSGRVTRRFGGCEFLPASILLRGHGENGWKSSAVAENAAQYNDVVPLVYGTAWYHPPVIFSRNDGNLTHMEVLLGEGEIEAVHRVLVNKVEIPTGQNGKDLSGSGWYNVVSIGNRTGDFNQDFRDAGGTAMGDPHGSMAVLSVVVPNRISNGNQLPDVRALVSGVRVSVFDETGTYGGEAFSANPAWVLLDLLRRCGWPVADFDLSSFSRAAAYCDAPVTATDNYGNAVVSVRRKCNLGLVKPKSAADYFRGIRNGAGLVLRFGATGKLELRIEERLSLQQAALPPGSNSLGPLAGGWPAYEFGDGRNGFSGILRQPDGSPPRRFWSRSTADAPNRLVLEFQDELNGFEQDSYALTDIDDVHRMGQEISATLTALGIPNRQQASDVAKVNLRRSIPGNRFAEFETSVVGLGLRPGDLITISHFAEELDRQLFRITKMEPRKNFETVRITAQWHEDSWYESEVEAGASNAAIAVSEAGVPRPVPGAAWDGEGGTRLEVRESIGVGADGHRTVELNVAALPSTNPTWAAASAPLVPVAGVVAPGEGDLAAGTYYYYFTALDGEGVESGVSPVVRVQVEEADAPAAIEVRDLRYSESAAGFRVYRGLSPLETYRIAESLPVSTVFRDEGRAKSLASPPDFAFHHVNFYWRPEILAETPATITGAAEIGNPSLHLSPGSCVGKRARISKGTGQGQERAIVSHSVHTVQIEPPWVVPPDATSHFVIAESSWQYAAGSESGAAVFEVPNEAGGTVHLRGVSANAKDEESPAELAVVTRYTVTGSPGSLLDEEPPAQPAFVLEAPGNGNLRLSGVAFADARNLQTIGGATLTVFAFDELRSGEAGSLAQAVPLGANSLVMTTAVNWQVGDYLQADQEIVKIVQIQNAGTKLMVDRGCLQTNSAAHGSGAQVQRLGARTQVIPFVEGFFEGSEASEFQALLPMPSVRIAAAEMYVTNRRGDSPTAMRNYVNEPDQGLRTLSGGSLALQVAGPLFIGSSITPQVIVDRRCLLQEVKAVVAEAPQGAGLTLRLRADGSEFATLTIAAGSTRSNILAGQSLAMLEEGQALTLDVVNVPPAAAGSPGRDLTVLLRR